jgi:hypothetical protein
MNGSGIYDNNPRQRRFTEGGGVQGEIGELRKDLRHVSALAALTVEEYTNALAGGAATLKAATATVASEVVLLPADLLQPALLNLAVAPRKLTFTTAGATPANAPASVTIKGTNAQGESQSEVLVLAQTAAAVTSAKFYASIESLTYPAADGTAATVAIGTEATKIGLTYAPKARAGLTTHLFKEISAGAVVTTGALTTPAADAPFGAYVPAAAPNGTVDYAIYYEFDPSI